MGDSDEEVYEVEKILNHKVVKGVTMYKLKWKGYPMSDSTWEKEKNLDCQNLLEEYWKNVKSPKKTQNSPNTLSPQNKRPVSSNNQEKKKKENKEQLPSIFMGSLIQKKIDTSSLALNPSKDREEKIKLDMIEKERQETKRKKEIQSQMENLFQIKDKEKEKDRKIEKGKDKEKEIVEKKKSILSNVNNEYEILAAATKPDSSSVLYLVKRKKNGESIQYVVTSEYARTHLTQPLINFFLNHLKFGKPVS